MWNQETESSSPNLRTFPHHCCAVHYHSNMHHSNMKPGKGSVAICSHVRFQCSCLHLLQSPFSHILSFYCSLSGLFILQFTQFSSGNLVCAIGWGIFVSPWLIVTVWGNDWIIFFVLSYWSPSKREGGREGIVTVLSRGRNNHKVKIARDALIRATLF